MLLSVIIVSYNVRYYLEQCLHSVFASKGKTEIEVFVVDNNSTDGSVAYLSERFPQVHFIANPDNRGFSSANNQAIRQAQGRYILLLNPDTIVTERTFTDCIQYLDQHPEVGATGISMYGADGRFAWESRRGIPTPWTAFCKMTGLTALFPHSRRFGRYYMRYLKREEANYIEVISGAFMMLRAEALQKIGLMDETFFMYGEDIDLSYRMLQGGWKNAYVPTPILHYKGESTQKSSYRYVHIFYEAMLIFFDKHLSRRYRLTALIIRLAVYLRAGIDIAKRTLQKPLAMLPHRQPAPERCLCIGTSQSLRQMQDICQRNNLRGTFVEHQTTSTENQSHNAIVSNCDYALTDDKYTYIVYDVSCFSYEQILSSLITVAGQGISIALGTYNPQTGVMILPNDIYNN